MARAEHADVDRNGSVFGWLVTGRRCLDQKNCASRRLRRWQTELDRARRGAHIAVRQLQPPISITWWCQSGQQSDSDQSRHLKSHAFSRCKSRMKSERQRIGTEYLRSLFEYVVVRQIVISLPSAENSSARKAATLTGGDLSSAMAELNCTRRRLHVWAASSKGI
jgi:hypothetical protein